MKGCRRALQHPECMSLGLMKGRRIQSDGLFKNTYLIIARQIHTKYVKFDPGFTWISLF